MLYIAASRNASTTEYEKGYDLVKFSITPNITQLWSEDFGYKLSVNETSIINDTAQVSLTMQIPEENEYTLSLINRPDNVRLILMQENTEITDLTNNSYTFFTDEGLYHYSLRMIFEPIVSYINNNETCKAQIYSKNNTIIIKQHNGPFTVNDGFKNIASGIASNTTVIPINNSGIYIVVLNNKTFKILVTE